MWSDFITLSDRGLFLTEKIPHSKALYASATICHHASVTRLNALSAPGKWEALSRPVVSKSEMIFKSSYDGNVFRDLFSYLYSVIIVENVWYLQQVVRGVNIYF